MSIENAPTRPKIETIHEDLSTKSSLKSTASTVSISSSASSKESVILNSNVTPNSPTVEQISPKFEQISPRVEQISPKFEQIIPQLEIETPKRDTENVRKNSTSSSSSSDSNKSENMSEEIPKYFPRKSSFSSPSELEVADWKNVEIFGQEPEECAIYDEAKVSKKIRTKMSESSDSDTSASETSFEADQPDFAVKLDAQNVLPKENQFVRTETIESSDLSENESKKTVQRQTSTSSNSENEQK